LENWAKGEFFAVDFGANYKKVEKMKKCAGQ
jgi:hypothetical protein